MKNQKLVCIYRNAEHEEKTKSELEKARQSLQAVLDVWNGLDLIPCSDIYSLILNPSEAYQKAINELAEVPETKGRFQISKAAFIETLDVPLPDALYRAARDARKVSYTNIPELWNVECDKIVLNEAEAENLINSQNIFISDPDKIKLAEDLNKLVTLFNSVNTRVNNELLDGGPYTGQYFRNKFTLSQKIYNGPFEISLDPAKLRQWLKI